MPDRCHVRPHLISLGLSELFSSLINTDGGRLNIGLDAVNQLSLVMDHGGQVLEYLVDVHDVGLQLGHGPLSLDQMLQVLFFLHHHLRPVGSSASLNIDQVSLGCCLTSSGFKFLDCVLLLLSCGPLGSLEVIKSSSEVRLKSLPL